VTLYDQLLKHGALDNDALLGRFLDYTTAKKLALYPAQEEAILELFAEKNVILNTPTGSGQSLVASALHFKSLAQGRRSFYTCPIKALVNEKFLALCRDFGPENVGMMTGDASVTQYDPRKFIYIGSANKETSICLVWQDAPVKTFEDILTKEVLVGGAGVTSSIRQYPMVLNNVLGTKFKLVNGYPGSREAGLAMERGEVNGLCGIQWTSFLAQGAEWMANNKVRIIAQMGGFDGDDELNKMKVPKIWDFVKTEADKRTLAVIFNQLEFGRPYVLPPGVPADRVAAFRKAFDETMKDPEFLAEAAKAKLIINPVNGDGVQKLVDDIYTTPKEDVERARAALK
jgi:hypothetical protein